MPQFAVYKSPLRDPSIAFVLQIQTSRFDRISTRVVMALMHRGATPPSDHSLTPHLTILGIPVYPDPLNIATIPSSRLSVPLAILPEADQARIITAIDELISRA
jgi:toxin CcdB